MVIRNLFALSRLRTKEKSWWRHQMEKKFPRYWPFVRGIHRSPVNSLHNGQWRGALVFSLICVWINSWANAGEAGDWRRYHAQYDVTVMWPLAARYCDVRETSSYINNLEMTRSRVCSGHKYDVHQPPVVKIRLEIPLKSPRGLWANRVTHKPSNYLNQCWLIVIGPLVTCLDQSIAVFFPENEFENVACITAAISSGRMFELYM